MYHKEKEMWIFECARTMINEFNQTLILTIKFNKLINQY